MTKSKLVEEHTRQLLELCAEIERDLLKLSQEEIASESSVSKTLLDISRLYSVFLTGTQVKRNYLFASVSALMSEKREKALELISQIGKVNIDLSEFKRKFVAEKKPTDSDGLTERKFEFKSPLVDTKAFIRSTYFILEKIKTAIKTENSELYPIIFESEKELKKKLRAKMHEVNKSE